LIVVGRIRNQRKKLSKMGFKIGKFFGGIAKAAVGVVTLKPTAVIGGLSRSATSFSKSKKQPKSLQARRQTLTSARNPISRSTGGLFGRIRQRSKGLLQTNMGLLKQVVPRFSRAGGGPKGPSLGIFGGRGVSGGFKFGDTQTQGFITTVLIILGVVVVIIFGGNILFGKVTKRR